MTTLTDIGLAAFGDIAIESDPIDALAVGTAPDSEFAAATALGNEVHRSVVSNGNVDLVSSSQTASGNAELIIRVSGGLEVAPDTDIAEIGAFRNGDLLLIENIPPVTVASGDREEFIIEIEPLREQS
jgi:hypothetical protein